MPDYILQVVTHFVAVAVGLAAGVWWNLRSEVKQAVGSDRWELVENIVALGIEFAERAGVVSAVKLDGEDKLKLAANFCKKQFKSFSIQIDEDALLDTIEAVLWRELNQFKDERLHPRSKQENEIS